jgi:tellurite resistance protein TerA
MCQNFGVDMEIRDPNRGVIELKKGQKVNLTKHGYSMGEIMINLNWSKPQQQRGFFAPRLKGIDLDLGCLFNSMMAEKRCPGFGQLIRQFLWSSNNRLDGDDRTGTSTDGENLRINGNMISQIRRFLVYTFIYEGAANWRVATELLQ